MKKNLLLFLTIVFSSFISKAQVICILCFDQNDSISQNVNNLVIDGGFENGCTVSQYFCPNSSGYSCNISNWTCTGGGTSTYAQMLDGSYDSYVVEGQYAAYFGNAFCYTCTNVQGDTSCLSDSSCTATGIQPGYPYNTPDLGGVSGISIEQTVNGLTPGSTYVLEFWAGGEAAPFVFRSAGLFGLDVGFGTIYLRNKPTAPASTDIGTRFIIVFNAASTSHTIRFTNWGHICNDCTELVVDNVRLYTLAELSPSVTSCNVQPSAIFSAPNHICPGTCTDFTNLSISATSFQWTFQGASPGTSTDVNPIGICYNTPGSYDVQLIASNVNGVDTLFLNNYITVYPSPPPQGITQIGDTLFAIAGASSYQWYYNGSLISGATDYYYVGQVSGDYNVVATDNNGCEVEAVIFDVLLSSNTLENEPNALMIYPNPADDQLNFSCRSITEKEVNISVVDVLGKKCIVPSAHCRLPDCTVDISQLSSGIYFLQVSDNEKTIRAKFVKQ